jgi:hypothetical protein
VSGRRFHDLRPATEAARCPWRRPSVQAERRAAAMIALRWTLLRLEHDGVLRRLVGADGLERWDLASRAPGRFT